MCAMTWTRLSDNYADRMALDGLLDCDLALDVQLLVWSNRLLTDGFVPRAMLAKAAPLSDEPEEGMRALVEAGLWTEVKGGWQRDWSDQETAERVKARQVATRERQATFRERSARCKAGDHSLCDRCEAVLSGRAKGRNGVTNRVTNGVSNASPSRPDPTLREGRDKGQTSATPPALDAPAATPPSERDSMPPDRLWVFPPGTGKAHDEQITRMNLAKERDGYSGRGEQWRADGKMTAWAWSEVDNHEYYAKAEQERIKHLAEYKRQVEENAKAKAEAANRKPETVEPEPEEPGEPMVDEEVDLLWADDQE